MKKSAKVDPHRILFLLLVLGLTAFCLNGCKTTGDTDDDNGSDLPWNTPQPWEGAPSIPGLNGMGG